jgi:hypothetical protein
MYAASSCVRYANLQRDASDSSRRRPGRVTAACDCRGQACDCPGRVHMYRGSHTPGVHRRARCTRRPLCRARCTRRPLCRACWAHGDTLMIPSWNEAPMQVILSLDVSPLHDPFVPAANLLCIVCNAGFRSRESCCSPSHSHYLPHTNGECKRFIPREG